MRHLRRVRLRCRFVRRLAADGSDAVSDATVSCSRGGFQLRSASEGRRTVSEGEGKRKIASERTQQVAKLLQVDDRLVRSDNSVGHESSDGAYGRLTA